MRKVEVEWDDSTTLTEGWNSKAHYIDAAQSLICTTVGYLIHEDDERVVLAMTHNPDNDDVNHGFSIPRACVKNIKTLQNGPTFGEAEPFSRP